MNDTSGTDTGTIHPRDYGSAGEGNSTQHHQSQHHSQHDHLERDRQEVFDAAVNLDYVLSHPSLPDLMTNADTAIKRLHASVKAYYDAVDRMIGRTEGPSERTP